MSSAFLALSSKRDPLGAKIAEMRTWLIGERAQQTALRALPRTHPPLVPVHFGFSAAICWIIREICITSRSLEAQVPFVAIDLEGPLEAAHSPSAKRPASSDIADHRTRQESCFVVSEGRRRGCARDDTRRNGEQGERNEGWSAPILRGPLGPDMESPAAGRAVPRCLGIMARGRF